MHFTSPLYHCNFISCVNSVLKSGIRVSFLGGEGQIHFTCIFFPCVDPDLKLECNCCMCSVS